MVREGAKTLWSAEDVRRVGCALLLGQLVSMSLAATSFTSSLIASRGVDTPLTQSLFTYSLIAAAYGAQFLYRRQKLMVSSKSSPVPASSSSQNQHDSLLAGPLVLVRPAWPHRRPRQLFRWVVYRTDVGSLITPDSISLLSFVLIHTPRFSSPANKSTGNCWLADFCLLLLLLPLLAVVKAYQFTSITSVMLLDCWTIPWVIVLTWIALGTRYSPPQFLGAAVCVLGLALVLVSDSSTSSSSGSSSAAASSTDGTNYKPLLGDSLVIAGTFCYAFSNVAEEFCVKKKSLVEFLAMLGVIGMLFSAMETLVLERKDLLSVQWSSPMVALFAGYAVASFTFYSLAPYVLKISGSTLFNLSLLTSDMWAVLIRIYVYRQQVDWLYFVAFAVVAVGLVTYSLGEMKTPTEDDDVGVITVDEGFDGESVPLVQDTPPSASRNQAEVAWTSRESK